MYTDNKDAHSSYNNDSSMLTDTQSQFTLAQDPKISLGSNSEENGKLFSNVFLFILLIFCMGSTSLLAPILSLQISNIYAQVAIGFGWSLEDKELYLGATQSAPIFANAAASFLAFLLSKYSPTKVIWITRLIFLIAASLTILPNTYLLIACRFVQGICAGFQFPFCASIIYESTPKRIRSQVGSTLSVMTSVGLITGFYFCAKVNLEKIYWRTYFLIPVGISLVGFLILTVVLRQELSITWMIQSGMSKDKILKNLRRYLTESAANELYDEYASKPVDTYVVSEASDYSKSLQEDTMHSPFISSVDQPSSKLSSPSIFTTYRNELIYGLKYGLINTFSLISVVTVYLIFFITRDREDNKESAFANNRLTEASIIELGMKFLSAYFGWGNKRRTVISLGMLLLGFSMGIIALLQFLNEWTLLKYTPLGLFLIIGPMVMAPFFGSLAEIFPTEVIGFILGFSTVITSVLDFLFPLLKVKQNDNEYLPLWSCMIAVIILIAGMANYFVTFEPHGMSKLQIREKLNSKKKRR